MRIGESVVLKELERYTTLYYNYKDKEYRYEDYYRKGYITRLEYVEGIVDIMEKELSTAKKVFLTLTKLPRYKDKVSEKTLEIYYKMRGIFN